MYKTQAGVIKNLLKPKMLQAEKMAKSVLGRDVEIVRGAEIEFSAISNVQDPDDFPIDQQDLDRYFMHSAYARGIDRTEQNKYHEPDYVSITPDGFAAEQIEMVLTHLKKSVPRISIKDLCAYRRKIRSGEEVKFPKVEGPDNEVAISADIMARNIAGAGMLFKNEATNFGLKEADLATAAIPGRQNCNAAHMHEGLVDKTTRENLYDDGTEHANKLLLSMLLGRNKFVKEGGLIFFAPTESAFKGLHTDLGPTFNGITKTRIIKGCGSWMIRGREYNTTTVGKEWAFDREAQGDVHLEDRLGQTEAWYGDGAILQGKDRFTFPAIYMVAQSVMFIEGLKAYEQMKQDGTLDTLTEEVLLTKEHQSPLASSLDEAIKQFENSDLMAEHFTAKERKAYIDTVRKIQDVEVSAVPKYDVAR